MTDAAVEGKHASGSLKQKTLGTGLLSVQKSVDIPDQTLPAHMLLWRG